METVKQNGQKMKRAEYSGVSMVESMSPQASLPESHLSGLEGRVRVLLPQYELEQTKPPAWIWQVLPSV